MLINVYICGKKHIEMYSEASYLIENICFSAANPHNFAGTRVNEVIATVLDFLWSFKNKN